MAFKNFIPEVWSATIERELERVCVFAEDCNRQYEGDVKQAGDQVRILGVGKPTIKTLARASATSDIDAPEEVEDTSVTMIIDQISYFNYMVGDIDKAQAKGNIMEALSQETSEGLAGAVDKAIAGLAADSQLHLLGANATQVTTSNVLTQIDGAVEWLRDNDVSPNTELVLTGTNRWYTLFKQAYQDKDTNNSNILEHGKVGMYANVTIKVSNNVAKANDGATDLIMVRTKRAIAFAQPLTHTEAYRPEKKFADAVKGFILYGCKIVRPKEIYVLNVKYTA